MCKKLISMLLAIVIAVGMLSVVTMNAAAVYPTSLYINGEQKVTSMSGKANGSGSIGGTWSYSNGELFLNDYSGGNIRAYGGDLKIYVSGICTVTSTLSSQNGYSIISVNNGALLITGTQRGLAGTLNVTGTTASNNIGGIQGTNGLEIAEAVNVNVNVASNKGQDIQALASSSGEVRISTSGKVNAIASNAGAGRAQGVHSNKDFIFSASCAMTAKGTATGSGKGHGVYTNLAFRFTGGSLDAFGSTYGIYAGSGVNINEAVVIKEGNTSANNTVKSLTDTVANSSTAGMQSYKYVLLNGSADEITSTYETVSMNYREVTNIETLTGFGQNGNNPILSSTSSDPNVVSVSQSGEIIATGKGSAIISVFLADGSEIQIPVTVSYTWLQWIIRILLLGFLWY